MLSEGTAAFERSGAVGPAVYLDVCARSGALQSLRGKKTERDSPDRLHELHPQPSNAKSPRSPPSTCGSSASPCCWRIAIGVPLGILLTRRPRWKALVLGSTNVVQTIPSLALFGLLLPLPWLGARADRLAIVALALYALLPIVRNTYVGIAGISAPVREAAVAMG